MKTFYLAVFVLLAATSVSLAQDVAKQLSAATGEIEAQLKSLPNPTELAQQCAKDINDARSSLKLGNSYFALYAIRTCKSALDSKTYVASKPDLARSSAAFDEEWKQFGVDLTKQDLNKSSKRSPLAVVALSQISISRARGYYTASRALANNNSLAEALSALGQARAHLDFARFCRGLRFPEPKTDMTLSSLVTEITKLGTAALRTYKAAGPDNQQAQYVRLKSTIELADELNRNSQFEGAFLEYLETEFYFGLIVTTAENEDLQHLRERSGEMGKLLKSGKTDQSIGLIFWQMAESSLNPPNAEPLHEQIKRAVVIMNRVLPAYFDYLKKNQSPTTH